MTSNESNAQSSEPGVVPLASQAMLDSPETLPPIAPNSASPAATTQLLPGEQALDETWHQQHRSELELGCITVFSTNFQFGLSMFSARRHVLMLRNPHDPNGRGFVLMEHANLAELCNAAWVLNGEFGGPSPSSPDCCGHSGSGKIAYEVYLTIVTDQEVREEIAARAADSLCAPQASAPPVPCSSTSSASSASTMAPSSSAANPTPTEDADDCPICFESIEPSDAAMRCAGSAGRHHYFHQHCMRDWLENSRRSSEQPTCPICRGQVQFHSQRLDAFLEGRDSSNLNDEERGFLREIADRLRGKGWSDAFTLENAKHYTGLFAAAGSGFALGYAQPPPGAALFLDMYIRTLPREHRVAYGVGWFTGLIVRIVRQARHEQRRQEDRRQRPRS